MLQLRFPTIPLPLLYKVIAFYLENQVEVDAYCLQRAAECCESTGGGVDRSEP